MKIYKLEKTMYKHGAYEDEFGDKVDGYSELWNKNFITLIYIFEVDVK